MRGRPASYSEDFCEKVIDFGKKGFSVWEMAMNLDVARSTLYRWAEEYDNFRDAFTRARDYSKAYLLQQARLNNGNKDYQPKITEILYKCLHDIHPQVHHTKSWKELGENLRNQAFDQQILPEQLESLGRALKDGIYIEQESELKPTLEKLKELFKEQQ